MKFSTITLFALIAISTVQAGTIAENETYQKCILSVGTLDCSTATNSSNCSDSKSAYRACTKSDQNKAACDINTQTDYSAYVKCVQGCYSKATDADAKKFYDKMNDCLSGSILASVAMLLFSLFALLF